MRNKIILANALIVLVCGLLTFIVVRMSIVGAAQNPAQLAEQGVRDAKGAAARFQLEALGLERWVAGHAAEPASHDFVSRATSSAKGDSASGVCDQLIGRAKTSFANPPTLALIVDAQGKIVGRNGSTQQRGDDLGTTYPALKESIKTGQSGSDVWVKGGGVDQYVVSYAPVRDDKGAPVGALVLGRGLNESIAQLSDAARGGGIVLLSVEGDVRVIAASSAATDAVKALIDKNKGDVKAGLSAAKVTFPESETTLGLANLDSLGTGHAAVLAAVAPPTLLDGASSMAMPILFVMVLGLVLVAVAGWFLGSYIQHPIETLEEGLLTILNGQSDRRFNLDHAELGGLAFRIDQLLNQLMGIDEDTSDETGRISRPPPPTATYGEAATETRPTAAASNEPAPQYYARLYKEYIAAKRGLGESVDHITEDAFVEKIRGMEEEALQKHGKAVRYQVQSTAKEVQLLAVPLA